MAPWNAWGGIRWLLSFGIFVAGAVVLATGIPPAPLPMESPIAHPIVASVRGTWTPMRAQAGPLAPPSSLAGEAELGEEGPRAEHSFAPEHSEPAGPEEPGREAPEPAAGRRYRVRAGDTMWGIAARLLGSGSRYREIEALNPDLVATQLRPGSTLLLPADAAPEGAEPRQGRGSPRKQRWHRVRKGESLALIARTYYQREDWRRIYEANRDRLKAPHRITAGVRLRIPAGDGEGR